ncbi:MAG: hypothetical protein ACRCX2_01625 [Paraclostridium sp.]
MKFLEVVLMVVVIIELLFIVKSLKLIKMINELLEDREKTISKQRVEITILKEKLKIGSEDI